MSATQITDRNISAMAHVPLGFLKHPNQIGRDDQDNWTRITAAFAKSQDLRLFIDDETSLSLLQIRSESRKIKRRHGLDLVVIDQLSFLTGAQSDKQWEATGEYTRGLIKLAKELDIAVVLLCQLNRECEKRQNKRPMVSDLAQSGSIEQDASVIMLLYRDEVYDESSRDRGIAEVHIGKQRQGSTCTLGMAYIADQTRFGDLGRPWSPHQIINKSRGLAEFL